MVMKERNNSDTIKNWKPNASAPLWDEESENEPKGPFFTGALFFRTIFDIF